MTHTPHYDFFVIGAGSGGVRASRIAATHGAKVGVAESGALGGTCVNVGCVPKKLLAYASDYPHHFEDAKGYGWTYETPRFDWNTLIERKNKEINRLNGIYKGLLDNSGATTHYGYASFTDANTLSIKAKDGNITNVTADKILIASGGFPRKSTIPGSEYIATSDDAFFLPEFPDEVVIIGGGYIAVEFAHIFAGLGADVTLLYRSELFLRGFDIDIRKTLAEEMKKQGVKLLFNTDADRVEKTNDGYITHTNDGQMLKCNLVMSAIGRDANTTGLNLGNAGVNTNPNGTLDVNDQYQTNIEHIYAIGDISSRYQLTPVALNEGHVLADRLFNKQQTRIVNYNNVATAVFSNPPIATVGLTDEEAQKEGYDTTVFKSSFRPMKFILPQRDEKTLMKIVVDAKTDKVLGIQMIGLDAPEMMQGFAVALNAGATKAEFDRTIGIHPTSAEEFVTMRTPIS